MPLSFAPKLTGATPRAERRGQVVDRTVNDYGVVIWYCLN